MTESIVKKILILNRMRLFNEWFILDDKSLLIDEINTVCDFLESRIKDVNDEEPEIYSNNEDEIHEDNEKKKENYENPINEKYEVKETHKDKFEKKSYESDEPILENSKICNKCKVVYTFDNYRKCISNKNDGLETICKHCRNKRNRERYVNKREIISEDDEPDFVFGEEDEEITIENSKKCKMCFTIKGFNCFYKNCSNKDGYDNMCKKCKSDKSKECYKNLHVDHSVVKKECKKCKEDKPMDKFYLAKENRDRRDTCCIECRVIERKERNKHKVDVEEKLCNKCNIILKSELFFKDNSSPDGLTTKCKTCYYTHQREVRTKRLLKQKEETS